MVRRFDPVNLVIGIIVGVAGALTLYPFVYVFSMSVSDPLAVMSREIWLLPKGFQLESYRLALKSQSLIRSYGNTLLYTSVGTLINLVLTTSAAYALSRKSFRLAGPVMLFVIITMFVSGGLIPTFILVRSLGLYNTRLAVILPYSVGAWNLIISRVYIQTSIPDSLVESAKMDGASELRILTSIIVPLSKPLLAIISLFAAVMFWNSYFPALLYLPNPKLQPVQVFLVRLLVYASNELAEETDNIVDQAMALSQIKYTVVIVTILPIVCLYPFLQKYFVKGIMIGAIKG